MKVYIATVDTNYETIAVANTEADAIRLAAQRAWEFLRDANALYPDTETPEKVAEYFGIYAMEIEVGTAILRG